MIKIGLAGVGGNNLQVGLGGPKLENNGGAIEAVAAAGTPAAIMRVASTSGSSDYDAVNYITDITLDANSLGMYPIYSETGNSAIPSFTGVAGEIRYYVVYNSGGSAAAAGDIWKVFSGGKSLLVPRRKGLLIYTEGREYSKYTNLALEPKSYYKFSTTDNVYHLQYGVLRDCDNYLRIERNSTTELQIEAYDTSKGQNFINVGHEKIVLSTPLTLTTSVHTIIADGTDSGVAPSASTMYYIYLSNSHVSFRPSSLALSLVAPQTTGYLALTGNGIDWKYVGLVYLNSSTQIGDSSNILGIFGGYFNYFHLTSDIVKSSGATGWYTLMSLPGMCLSSETYLDIIVLTAQKTGVNNKDVGTRLYIGGTGGTLVRDYTEQFSRANVLYSRSYEYKMESEIKQAPEILVQFYYTSGETYTVSSATYDTEILILRTNG